MTLNKVLYIFTSGLDYRTVCSHVGRMNRIIDRAEFEKLSEQFPQVPQASYQAGTGEYFVAEYNGNNLSRLVHFFQPIL